jgi:hypothetical protein
MRRATQKVHSDRRFRAQEWRLYAGDLKEFFGREFRIGLETYRIEGWLPRSPVFCIYVIRLSDQTPFVMSVAEVDSDTSWFNRPKRGKRR